MSKSKTFTVVSLFSGIGGMDLGFQYAGFETIWANEISGNAAKSYEINFGLKPTNEDINKISPEDIPDSDIIIGGPPCQSFSLVGKKLPNDPRGKLVFRFMEIVQSKLPKAFVMENVPGLAASRISGMRLTQYLAEELNQAGYNVKVVKLNAVDFMIPQRRNRIFIIGIRNGEICLPEPTTFAKECYNIDLNEFDVSARGAIGDLGACVCHRELAQYKHSPHSIFSSLMRKNNNDKVTLHECPTMSNKDIELLKHIPPGGNYQDVPDDISTMRIMNFKKSGGRTTTYGRLHPDRPSYTINTYFRRPNVGSNFHYSEPRLITPREAMRFQSLPDHFQICYSSQDERNAFIGNAVPPLLAHAIAWSLKNGLERRKGSTPRQGRLF